MEIAVKVLEPLMEEIVLVETEVLFPEKLEDITVTAPDPPVQLLNVFPVIVLVGPLVAEAPSVLLQPAIAVVPVTVIFEKLLPVWVIVEPSTEEAFAL